MMTNGGWEIQAGRARRSLRRLAADATAVLVLAVVIFCFHTFGGLR